MQPKQLFKLKCAVGTMTTKLQHTELSMSLGYKKFNSILDGKHIIDFALRRNPLLGAAAVSKKGVFAQINGLCPGCKM